MLTIYSQRDWKWRNKKIGQSNVTVGEKGCTLTDICMGGSFFGDTITPDRAAEDLEFTLDGRVLWASIDKLFRHMAFHWRFYSYDRNMADEALANPNKVMILNVDRGEHWVFALKRIPMTDMFWVADPWDGKKKVYRGVVGGAILKRK
jgi:hypothetical protein